MTDLHFVVRLIFRRLPEIWDTHKVRDVRSQYVVIHIRNIRNQDIIIVWVHTANIMNIDIVTTRYNLIYLLLSEEVQRIRMRREALSSGCIAWRPWGLLDVDLARLGRIAKWIRKTIAERIAEGIAESLE